MIFFIVALTPMSRQYQNLHINNQHNGLEVKNAGFILILNKTLTYPEMQIFILRVCNYNMPVIADNFLILFYSLI